LKESQETPQGQVSVSAPAEDSPQPWHRLGAAWLGVALWESSFWAGSWAGGSHVSWHQGGREGRSVLGFMTLSMARRWREGTPSPLLGTC